MPRYNCLAADNVPLIERAMPHANLCMRHQRDVAKLFIPAFAGVTLLIAVTALLNISYTVIVNKSYL